MAKKKVDFTTDKLRALMISDLHALRGKTITLEEATTRANLANGIIETVKLESVGQPRAAVVLG